MIRSRALAVLAALSIGVSACSSDSSSEATETTAASATASSTVVTPSSEVTTETVTTDALTTEPAPTDPPATDAATTVASAPITTAKVRPLEVLVTDDDGYDAAGIDAVVEYLRSRGDMNVTVVAPAANQSGAGDKSTPAALTATDVTTASGYAAKAVAGFPADSVNWALDGGVTTTFDLIVSGSNLGQNYGPLTAISGTVGAAATGARRGVPAISISQGFPAAGADFDFPSSVKVLSEYLDSTIASYRDGVGPLLVSINVPTCPVGVALLPTLEIISAASDNGRQLGAPTACDGKPGAPADDIDAFNAGHPTVSQLDPTTLAGIPA